MKACPNCSLLNPDDGQSCDCGYDFVLHRFPLTDPRELLRRKRRRRMMVGSFILLALSTARLLGVKKSTLPTVVLGIVIVGVYAWAFWPWDEYWEKYSSSTKSR